MSPRRSYYSDYAWAPYVSQAQRRHIAARKVAALRRDGREISPVKIDGRKIARTFWGTAWCENLEGYSDFSNRLPRGRTYVRNGSVIDLQVTPGVVRSLVSGSEIYSVEVAIRKMSPKRWKGLCSECAGGIDSLVELLRGRFSESVMEVLCRGDAGLFPAPREISMSCSCPDWATMCKHVAATLYGIGARLDERPELLFVLRQVDETELIQAAGTTVDFAPAGVGAKGEVLVEDDLSEIFGIEMEESAPPPPSRRKRARAGGKRTRRPKPRAGTRITAKELTARGVPHSTMQGWLRNGALEHSGERGVYRRTATTEETITGYLQRANERSTGPGPESDATTPTISAQDLTACGIPRSTISSWLVSGVLARSSERGVYLTTDKTEARLAEYDQRRWGG